MTAINTWPFPDRPGVPINPQQNGWHWVNGTPREWVVFDDGPSWRLAGVDYRPQEWAHRIYQGPCLTPEEVRAKDARIAESEGALQKKGCARDQNTTQFCAEAAAKAARIAKLERLLGLADSWISAAIECKEWRWDADQHEAATLTRDEIRAALGGKDE